MKRSRIFLRTKLSEHEIDLLKKDLFDHALQSALKIKNLNFDKPYVEEVVKNAVDRVMLTFKFGEGNGLGDAVKTQVISDLRAEHVKVIQDGVSKVVWPDLDKGKYFDKLMSILKKIKLLSLTILEIIIADTMKLLTERRKDWFLTIYSNPSLTYSQLSKKFGKRGVHPSEEVKAIYLALAKILKKMEIEL